MANKDKKKRALLEDEDPEFEAALRKLPVVDVLPAEWDCPEDDIYDEIYKDIGNGIDESD